MAEIKGFSAIRYNTDKVSLEKVSAPPYDVISDKERERFYALDEHNVVRLILDRINDDDTENNNRYTRAASRIKEWLNEGVLKQDDKDYLYLLVQKYKNKYGEEKSTVGFISAVKLHPWSDGVILPHERTLRGPKVDRMELFRATKTNLSPIYLMYEDENDSCEKMLLDAISKREKAFEYTDNYGVVNALYLVDGEDKDALEKAVSSKTLYIADGHHRYETMLAYRDERRTCDSSYSDDKPYNFAMAYLTASAEKRLTVYPTHRLLFGFDEHIIDSLVEKASSLFNTETLSVDSDEEKEKALNLLRGKEKAFGYYTKKGFTILSLKNNDISSLLPGVNKAVASLDVTILHTVILENIMGLTKEAQSTQTNLHYTRDDDEAFEALNNGYQGAFFMNATPLKAVLDVSKEGEVMPQKSTYFFPKLPSAIVFRSME